MGSGSALSSAMAIGHAHTTQLGNSDVVVDRVSLGTAALGGMYRSVPEDDVAELFAAAFEAGISLFDTAPQYGHGRAEQRVGEQLRVRDRDSFTLSTKVGRVVVDNPDGDTGIFADAPPSELRFGFDRDSILRSLEDSLARLGTDRIDVALIHDPDEHVAEAINEAYPTLAQLRDEGVVDAIGVGMNQSAVPARFIEETDIDVVLLAGRYTLLDQTALDDLIPAARRSGVSIMIGGVFNSGVLVDPDGSPMFDYGPAPIEVVQRAKQLQEVCRSHGVELAQAALAFPYREPSVATVLLGARSGRELGQSLAMLDRCVPDDLWVELSDKGLIRELDR